MLCAPTVEDVLPRSGPAAGSSPSPPRAPRTSAAYLARADGVPESLASYAARASQGHIGRARALARDEATRNRRREVVTLPARLTSLGACMTAAANLAEVTKEEADVLTAIWTLSREGRPRPRLRRRRAVVAGRGSTPPPWPPSSVARRPAPSAATSTPSTGG